MKDYRPINLLSAAYKLFTKAIANRIKTTLDFNPSNDGVGFCKSCSTMGHIEAIDQVIDKYAEYKEPLYTAFTDYGKASDSFHTSAVIPALRNQGVEESYVKILEDIYHTAILHTESNKIPIRKGVRHDATISLMLFTACF